MDTVRRYSMLIDGDWVDTEHRFEIRSPATEELVASVAKGGREHADRAIAAAKAAHADGRWRRTPPHERAAVLSAIAERLTEQVDDLAVLEALENGAPVRQAGAFQIGFSIAHLRYFADLAAQLRLRADRAADAGAHAGQRDRPPRAGRGVRGHRAVELPAAPGHVEDRPGAGRGQHPGRQARRAHPADAAGVRPDRAGLRAAARAS